MIEIITSIAGCGVRAACRQRSIDLKAPEMCTEVGSGPIHLSLALKHSCTLHSPRDFGITTVGPAVEQSFHFHSSFRSQYAELGLTTARPGTLPKMSAWVRKTRRFVWAWAVTGFVPPGFQRSLPSHTLYQIISSPTRRHCESSSAFL